MLYHEWLLEKLRQYPLFPHHCDNCEVGIPDGSEIKQSVWAGRSQKLDYFFCGQKCREDFYLKTQREMGL